MTREEAIKYLEQHRHSNPCGRKVLEESNEAIDMAIDALQVKPRLASRWIDADLDPNFAKCKKCSENKVDIAYSKDFIKQERWNFCPNCGAKMDKESEKMTNREWLESLSDKEMGRWISILCPLRNVEKPCRTMCNRNSEHCEADIAEWLMEEHKESGWILCSESLPKNGDWVFVTILDENGDTPYRYADFGWYLKAANCWIVDAEPRTDVTAWMPLPKPYREDDEI